MRFVLCAVLALAVSSVCDAGVRHVSRNVTRKTSTITQQHYLSPGVSASRQVCTGGSCVSKSVKRVVHR